MSYQVVLLNPYTARMHARLRFVHFRLHIGIPLD
jgi:hypothetical protein